MTLGNKKQSPPLIKKILKKTPPLEKFMDAGHRHLGRKEYKQAVGSFTKAVEAGFNHASAYYNRGRAYALAGKLRRAESDFTKVISLVPQSPRALHERGKISRSRKEYQKAVCDFTRAIELEPGNASFRNSRGFTFALLENYDKAVEDFTKTIELDRRFARAYYNRAAVYRTKKQYSKAISDHRSYLELSPGKEETRPLINIERKDKGRGTGETAACPCCGEAINPGAMRCRFCGMNLLEFSPGKKKKTK